MPRSNAAREALARGETPALRRADPVIRELVMVLFRTKKHRPAKKNRPQRTRR
jgi:hypothetical protein